MITTLIALSTVAEAAREKVVATKSPDVTIEKLKAATTPLEVATFDAMGKKMAVRCWPASGELACELYNKDESKVAFASTDLKICKEGNDFAIIGDKEGISGKMVIIPSGMILGDPTKKAACGG